jgi:calcium-binding protein CML
MCLLFELEIEKINFEDFLKLLENVWHINDSLIELKEAMNALDSKANGYLTVEELRHILLETGECLDEHDFKEILKSIEVQPDGTINNEGWLFFLTLALNF